MFNNRFLGKMNELLKQALVIRLVLMFLFLSLHPSSALAQSTVAEKPVVVAIIDQGVDFSNPKLKSYQWNNEKESLDGQDNNSNGLIDDINGWNFLDFNNNLTPKGPHATQLAGLIAPHAQIMPLIACEEGKGCNETAIVRSIYYAVDNGANVINLSLGDTSGYKSVYNNAIKYAYNHNVVVVASAGSSETGINLSKKPMSPICNDNGQNMVLGVGTIDQQGNTPSWANFGSCIDVTAQGENIYTTFSPAWSSGQTEGFVNGNSFATAFVSGEVAKLIAYDRSLSASDIITRLHNNASGKNLIINLDAAEKNLVAKNPPTGGKVLGISVTYKQIINKPKLQIR